jgi:DNA-binding HxlR family transcriptional regulator
MTCLSQATWSLADRKPFCCNLGMAARRSTCPISFALDLLGDRWTMLVVRDFVFGGKRRFSEFAASSEGIATNVLTDRLQRLQKARVIESERDPLDGRKVIYRLTEKGLALIPALVELARWGAAHDPKTGAPPAVMKRIKKDREAFIDELAERLRAAD